MDPPGSPSGRWQWPAPGPVLNGFGAGGAGRGIDIGGELGSPITAAASGEVVYSGAGLVGYGNLIIIKHGDPYLSAYAHAQRLLVNEGDRVTAGEHIADMGRKDSGDALLHFEIRRDGQPIDPISLLPKR